MVFKPSLEQNMDMSHKNGDGLELSFFFYDKESIKLFKRGKKNFLLINLYNIPSSLLLCYLNFKLFIFLTIYFLHFIIVVYLSFLIVKVAIK